MQTLIRRKIATIAERFHYEAPTLELSGVRLPRNLTLMALSFLLDGNHLIFGDPGWGKTTSAKVLASVFTGVPYDLYDKIEMRGNPQKYEEKTIARPDYGALATGRESVIWLGALGTPVLVVDELNRFSLEMQDVLLQGIDTGTWQYLNATHVHKAPAFFTANFRGESTNSFLPPLLDRMAIMTEEKYAGAMADYHAALGERQRVLCAPKLSSEALSRLDAEGIAAFLAFLDQHRLETVEPIRAAQREEIKQQIQELPCAWYDEQLREGHNDALLFFYAFTAELNHSEQYGCKRVTDPISDDTHDLAHLGCRVHSSFSPRSQMAALDYARGLAWLLGDECVEIDHFKAVLPHVIAHRFEFSSEFRNNQAQVTRAECEELHLAHQLVEEAHEHYRQGAPGLLNLLATLQELRGASRNAELLDLDPDAYDHPLAKEMILSAQADLTAGSGIAAAPKGTRF